jgi:hypothetical protein
MNANMPHYWFRAKSYGLGWGLPCAWQGWVFFIAWLIVLPVGLHVLTPGDRTLRFGFISAMVMGLLGVCYFKGDPAGRRWNSGDG